jgi:hypothetical protein
MRALIKDVAVTLGALVVLFGGATIIAIALAT